MTSVYDALQRVRQGSGQAVVRPVVMPGERATAQLALRPAVSRTPGPIAAELTPLLSVIRPLIDDSRGAVVHFVATATGEGASTMAREFALLAGTTGRRRTLLIDATRDRRTARHFDCDTSHGLVDGLWVGFDEAELQRHVVDTTLAVACLVGERGASHADPATLATLYDQLRRQFELIVLDCAALEQGEYPTLLPDQADGIFLVIRAESTRPVVISHARAMVEQAGGRFLGVVFNRRRNYIPDFLYRML
jgi:protein-tyrosine kinase